jgi:hypothetical protein
MISRLAKWLLLLLLMVSSVHAQDETFVPVESIGFSMVLSPLIIIGRCSMSCHHHLNWVFNFLMWIAVN